MRLTNKMRTQAAEAMAQAVYGPQFEELEQKYYDLGVAWFNKFYQKEGMKALNSGVDPKYLSRMGTIDPKVQDEPKGDNIYGLQYNLLWYTTKFFKQSKSTKLTFHGWDKRYRTATIKLPSPQVVPASYNGDHILKTAEFPEMAEEFKALTKAQRSLVDEASEYETEVRVLLEGMTTLKKVEADFPAAVKYLPKPAPKPTALIPVEQINKVTERLNAATVGA